MIFPTKGKLIILPKLKVNSKQHGKISLSSGQLDVLYLLESEVIHTALYPLPLLTHGLTIHGAVL